MARRRDRGEGSITRRKDGRWEGRLDLGWRDGKRDRRSVYGRTRQEVVEQLRALSRQKDDGTLAVARESAITVAEYIARWLESVRDKVEPNTYRGYEQRARTHIVRDLGKVKLAKLNPLVIEHAEALWLRQGNRRTGGPLDPQTVLHIHRVLHVAMERAVKWRLVPVNPVNGVESPHVPDREGEFLTADEAERLVTALVGREFELPILVGLYCGLRPTEYLALRWRDVDLDGGELRVTQNVHSIRNDDMTEHAGREVWGFRFGPAKTHRSKRPVSIPPLLVALLKEHEKQQTAAREQAGPAWVDLGLVFTDARGYPHKDHRVRRVFYKALEAAKVRRVVLYALRHTMATLVLHDTKDLKLVATRLGHRDETLVLRRYGHLLPGVDRQAADRLGEVVRRVVGGSE